jgi:hypothetical protein
MKGILTIGIRERPNQEENAEIGQLIDLLSFWIRKIERKVKI